MLLGRYRAREARTLEKMVHHYCQGHHPSVAERLCDECQALLDYSLGRLHHCPFAENKPVCSNCLVHCYSRPKRVAIQQIMRWAGPRLIWRAPYLALSHLLDKRRIAPSLPSARPSEKH